ncbi:Putative protein of unknown function [Podospora comata]|uniref:Myb-like DNA-binding domain-containing protein n=1 Tax=Podospora comata TaxID=48703 RepID=A0ABY6SG98_PODCO|nr:Putative protein of unknown function [Podospora comata]
MPALDAEQHLRFLLSCVKHASAGRVNFDAVSQELGIVSKAAAAKRYERLLKAHDLTPANVPKNGEASAAKTPTKRKRKDDPVPVKPETDESEEMPMMAKKKTAAAVKKGGKKGEDDLDDKNNGGGVKMSDIPEFSRHLLDGKKREEGGEVEVEDEDEVVYMGESFTGMNGGQQGVKNGGGGGGEGGGEGDGNGWNFANQGFLLSQSRSPPVMMSSGRRGNLMGVRGGSDPSLTPVASLPRDMGFFSHHVLETPSSQGGVGGYDGSGSGSAASVAGVDVDLHRIYQGQFGGQGYEGWGN